MAWHFGENVLAGKKREYGHTKVTIQKHSDKAPHIDKLFKGIGSELEVYMSHSDKLQRCPDSFNTIATTENAPFAGIAHDVKPWFGIQFHAEVSHTPRGKEVLKNFAVDICNARRDWTMEEFVEREIARIRAVVGPKGQVLGAVSGGVDSTVCTLYQGLDYRILTGLR